MEDNEVTSYLKRNQTYKIRGRVVSNFITIVIPTDIRITHNANISVCSTRITFADISLHRAKHVNFFLAFSGFRRNLPFHDRCCSSKYNLVCYMQELPVISSHHYILFTRILQLCRGDSSFFDQLRLLYQHQEIRCVVVPNDFICALTNTNFHTIFADYFKGHIRIEIPYAFRFQIN